MIQTLLAHTGTKTPRDYAQVRRAVRQQDRRSKVRHTNSIVLFETARPLLAHRTFSKSLLAESPDD